MLFCIGEIGCLIDFLVDKELEIILFFVFDSYGDEVKGAFALTFGRVVVGNCVKYFLFIVLKFESDFMEY